MLGHCFGSGLASAAQLSVLHVTVPGVPDPDATPHSVAHPVGSPCSQVPATTSAHDEIRYGVNLAMGSRNFTHSHT